MGYRRKRKRKKRKIDIPNQAPVQVPNIKVIKVIGTKTSIKAQTRKLAHRDILRSLAGIQGHPLGRKSGVKKAEKRREKRRIVLKKTKTEKKKERKRMMRRS